MDNRYQRFGEWQPEVAEGAFHPVFCTEGRPAKRLKLQAQIEAVPRTTDEGHLENPDALSVVTLAGDPAKCDKDGTILCRYRLPIWLEHYMNFDEKNFLGTLSADAAAKVRAALELRARFGSML